MNYCIVMRWDNNSYYEWIVFNKTYWYYTSFNVFILTSYDHLANGCSKVNWKSD
jgi:succinate dehydrogenase hydrophobic anchor subunit